jgi:hypothetical protein
MIGTRVSRGKDPAFTAQLMNDVKHHKDLKSPDQIAAMTVDATVKLERKDRRRYLADCGGTLPG